VRGENTPDFLRLQGGGSAGLRGSPGQRIQRIRERSRSPYRATLCLSRFHRGNLLAAQFELRLDEDEKAGAGLCHGYCGRDYLPDRDERNINHHNVDAFGKVFNPQFARIPLDWNNARILAQLPVKLFDVYVDGVDTFGALLEQAIREAAV